MENKIEQGRFSYVLQTIESNLENMIDKLSRCHPSSKSTYSFVKLSKPTSFLRQSN